MKETLKSSFTARRIYGLKDVSSEFWMNYTYVLLAIAGADKEVSAPEMEWLTNDFLVLIDTSSEFKKTVQDFDYKKANLKELIQNIQFNGKLNLKRALLYDAIKMSRADEHYSEHEQQAVNSASGLLQIPLYMARTIEGLINTEKSLDFMRRAIFETKVNKPSQKKEGASNDMQKKLHESSKLIQEIYGLEVISDEIQYHYACALLSISGSDGLVSEEERNWYFKDFVEIAETPTQIIEKLISFDYQKANLQEHIDVLSKYDDINFTRTLLYNSIRMAKADGVYANEERAAVADAAQMLNITDNIKDTIEFLISTEENVEKMRRSLFYEE